MLDTTFDRTLNEAFGRAFVAEKWAFPKPLFADPSGALAEVGGAEVGAWLGHRAVWELPVGDEVAGGRPVEASSQSRSGLQALSPLDPAGENAERSELL